MLVFGSWFDLACTKRALFSVLVLRLVLRVVDVYRIQLGSGVADSASKFCMHVIIVSKHYTLCLQIRLDQVMFDPYTNACSSQSRSHLFNLCSFTRLS